MRPSSSRRKPAIPEWFRQARFGMFILWGAYAVLGHGEQPLFRELLNPSEYRKLADRFRPERFDPDDWVRTARKARMKYMVLTAKHHDGFCLFDTSTTEYNAVKRGPGRDLLADYIRACRKGGLRVGVYFSLADWSVPAHFAGPKQDPEGFRRFIRMTHRQVEEIVSNYGRIDLLWFDGANYFTARQWQSVRMARMIRSRQPGILINNRLPRPKKGDDWGYPTPKQRIGEFSESPWESCITATRKFWGYHRCHEDPSMWYTRRELLEMFVRIITQNGNLLLNVGPRADGTFPELFRENTAFLGEWIERNREAVYGTRPAFNCGTGMPFEFAYGGCLARKDNHLYLFFLYWPGREFSLPGFRQRVVDASFVDGGRKVLFRQEPHRIILFDMPEKPPDICTVVRLTFTRPPEPAEWATKQLWKINLEGMENWSTL